MKLVWAIAVFITFYGSCFAQYENISTDEWIKKLSDPNDKKNEALILFRSIIIESVDTSGIDNQISLLQASATKGNLYFKKRLNLLQASFLVRKNFLQNNQSAKGVVIKLMKEAMYYANETNDEYLVAYCSYMYFSVAIFYDELELSVMYGMYSEALYEKIFGGSTFHEYIALAEQMYRIREYEQCKTYCFKWLNLPTPGKPQPLENIKMFTLNTLALAYHRTGQYDSAMYYYQKSLVSAKLINMEDWDGILSGNMGQVYYLQKKYDSALALLDKDYRISSRCKYFDNAANALQWSARANIAKGNYDKALQQIREAIALIKLLPNEGYLQNIYFAAVEVYKANGLVDSAIYYSRLTKRYTMPLKRKSTQAV